MSAMMRADPFFTRDHACCQRDATVAAALAWKSIDGPQLWADVECLPEGIASSACSRAAHELCQVRRIEKEVFVLVPRMFRAFIKLAYECACQVWGSLVQMRLVPFAPSPSVALDPSFRPIPLGWMRSCKF